MLLGNAHVMVALRKTLVELDHARAFAHGGGDGHQAFVLLGHVAQPAAKDLGEGGLGRRGGLGQAHGGVELAGAVVGNRVGLGQLVALAFFGHHMQKLRAFEVLDVLQRRDQRVQVVPVDGADVVEAKIFKQGGRHHHAFGVRLQALGQLKQRRRIFEHLLAHAFGRRIKLPTHELGQVTVERAHGRADAHVVVVEHHQQAAVGHAGVVQGLKSHARAHGTVANDGHRVALLALLLGRQRHAQGRRDGGGRVRRAKGVVLAFVAPGETRQAAQLAQRVHAIAPAGQDFVRVSLVAHVPHQAIVGGVKHIVQGHGQLHCAQVRAQMPACARDALEQVGPQLLRQSGQLRAGQAAQIGRAVDGVKQGVHQNSSAMSVRAAFRKCGSRACRPAPGVARCA